MHMTRDPIDFNLFVKHYNSGLSWSEISKRMGHPIGSFRAMFEKAESLGLVIRRNRKGQQCECGKPGVRKICGGSWICRHCEEIQQYQNHHARRYANARVGESQVEPYKWPAGLTRGIYG
jgi:ribosomal protein L37AE/L43A